MTVVDLLPPQRLALAYAPARARPAWTQLLALDARFARFVRSRREPVLAQVRLAWWRERLGENPGNWPSGEPLLAALASWGTALPRLARLAEGWEALLAEPPLPADAIEEFANGRAEALQALAGHLGCAASAEIGSTARLWALADLAAHLSDPGERTSVLAAAAEAGPQLRLPRAMRPLAVLAALARARNAGAPPWRQGLVGIRAGIFGI